VGGMGAEGAAEDAAAIRKAGFTPILEGVESDEPEA